MSSASVVGSEFSVGSVLQRGGTFDGVGSARYAAITAKLTEMVRRKVADEQQRIADALVLPVPYAVGVDQISRLQTEYPEFSLLSVALYSGVHSSLEAERFVATAYSLARLHKFTDKVVSLGNSVLVSALLGLRGVHTEMRPDDAYAVHACHTNQYIYDTMAQRAKGIELDCGYVVNAADYASFLHKGAFRVCDTNCNTTAGGYFADLSIYPLSLVQYCTGMAEVGAEVGEAILPYSSEMLVSHAGEWSRHGVHYEITANDVIFKYLDGVAGATVYPLSAWYEWVHSGDIRILKDGITHVYQVELVGVRGSFLQVTVTHVDYVEAPKIPFSVHALELPTTDEPKYYVRSFKLKSLACDPFKRSSYEPVTYYPSRRIVDRIFVHAMSLDKEAFKDGAIMKRVSVVDGRVVFAGMSVSVTRPMPTEMFAQLTQDIVLRAFVARYNMGELSADLMASLHQVKGFATASVPMKLCYLTCAMFKCAWKWTVGGLVDTLRSALKSVLAWFKGVADVRPEFTVAPQFVLFETYTKWLSNGAYTRVSGGSGANVTVPYLRGAAEAFRAVGSYLPGSVPVMSESMVPVVVMAPHGINDDIVDTTEPALVTDTAKSLVAAMRELNEFAESPASRFEMSMVTAVHAGKYDPGPEDYVYDDAAIHTINDVHEHAFPGMGLQNFEADVISQHYDPQHRGFEAEYLAMPLVPNPPPKQLEVFKSKVNTYRTERRIQTRDTLLSAAEARNMAAPQISEPTNIDAKIQDIWDNFLDMCCLPDARDKIAAYRADRVTFEREVLEEWTKKANPAKIKSMLAELLEEAKSVEEYDIDTFEAMVKSDAKPPLSTKPINELVAPQVIVYHKPVLSALYSSIFRVLTRRFLSLLKPEWMVNLLKDNEAVRQHLSTYFPWDADVVEFLENDYSKFDKSQSELCVRLEMFQNEQLGMDLDLLANWFQGHERSRIRCIQHALVLMISWQRRSGGGNTSYGNVTLNILSTAYVYRHSEVACGVYIGDDSLLVCRRVVADAASVKVLADVFNLTAKFLVPRFPYFASNFVLFDMDQRQAVLVPDPFKRAQRLGISVNAQAPEWDDRVRSHHENSALYKHGHIQTMMVRPVLDRYQLNGDEVDVVALLNALASTAASYNDTRGCWEASSCVIQI